MRFPRFLNLFRRHKNSNQEVLTDKQIKHLKQIVESAGQCKHGIKCKNCPIDPMLCNHDCNFVPAYRIAVKLLQEHDNTGTCVSIWR